MAGLQVAFICRNVFHSRLPACATAKRSFLGLAGDSFVPPFIPEKRVRPYITQSHSMYSAIRSPSRAPRNSFATIPDFPDAPLPVDTGPYKRWRQAPPVPNVPVVERSQFNKASGGSRIRRRKRMLDGRPWMSKGRERKFGERFGREGGFVGGEKRRMFKELGYEEATAVQRRYQARPMDMRMDEAMRRVFRPIERRRPMRPKPLGTLDPTKLTTSDYMSLSWGVSCWITTHMPMLKTQRPESIDVPGTTERASVSTGSRKRVVKIEDATEEKVPAAVPGKNDMAAELAEDQEIPQEDTTEAAESTSTLDDHAVTEPVAPTEPLPKSFARTRHLRERNWAMPRFVRGRHETRKYRRRSRRHLRYFHEYVQNRATPRRLLWYKLPHPRSFFRSQSGFLYLYTPPPGGPLSAAGLRFRVTNDPDPASFPFGRDLEHDGVPWTVPLAYGPIRNPVIRRLIYKDNLLPVDVLRRCGRLRQKIVRAYVLASRRYQRVRKAWLSRRRPNQYRAYKLHRDTIAYCPLVYAQKQPFVVDFARTNMRWFVLTTNAEGLDEVLMYKLRLPRWRVRAAREKTKRDAVYESIYTGSAVCCFEVVHLAEANRRVVVMRVLDVINTVRPRADLKLKQDPPKIEKGSLLPYVHPILGVSKPWFEPHRKKGEAAKRPEEPILKALMSLPKVSL